MSEFDFTLTIQIVAKKRSLTNFDEIMDNLKVRLTQLKDADKIDSAKIQVSQVFKDQTWEYP